jgi:hypothetical protein
VIDPVSVPESPLGSLPPHFVTFVIFCSSPFAPIIDSAPPFLLPLPLNSPISPAHFERPNGQRQRSLSGGTPSGASIGL